MRYAFLAGPGPDPTAGACETRVVFFNAVGLRVQSGSHSNGDEVVPLGWPPRSPNIQSVHVREQRATLMTPSLARTFPLLPDFL